VAGEKKKPLHDDGIPLLPAPKRSCRRSAGKVPASPNVSIVHMRHGLHALEKNLFRACRRVKPCGVEASVAGRCEGVRRPWCDM
jgi:hypothetical protein